jgi:hypothetical protein
MKHNAKINPRKKATRVPALKGKSDVARSKPKAVVPSLAFNQPPADQAGFVALLLQRISWANLCALANPRPVGRRGRPAHQLSAAQLILGVLFHYAVSWAGSLAQHMALLGLPATGSTLSERRQVLGWAPFERLLALVLRPLAAPATAAFYRGLRLVGIDGVDFSLPNTPKVQRQCKKGGNQYGRAAFAKLRASVLVELITHNPLAACLGWHGESEWQLARGLAIHLPLGCLLLADRLYGCGAFIWFLLPVLQACRGHFLLRVKSTLKVKRVLKRFRDGSRLVEIRALNPDNYHQVLGTVVVRQIQATVGRPGFRSETVRLWTSLTDPRQDPALALVRLYTQRWEQELYFRELKYNLNINDLLQSQTPETAAQELAARIIASSLVAEVRSQLCPGEALSHRISFLKTWQTLEPMWLIVLVCADLLTPEQQRAITQRLYEVAATYSMDPKRSRSCFRGMRQPLQPWPRKRNQPSVEGPITIGIQRDL